MYTSLRWDKAARAILTPIRSENETENTILPLCVKSIDFVNQ